MNAQTLSGALLLLSGAIAVVVRYISRSLSATDSPSGAPVLVVDPSWSSPNASAVSTSPAASPPEGAAGEPLTIILAKRQAHADCLVITQVCDRAEAQRRAARYYPLPSEPRVA